LGIDLDPEHNHKSSDDKQDDHKQVGDVAGGAPEGLEAGGSGVTVTLGVDGRS